MGRKGARDRRGGQLEPGSDSGSPALHVMEASQASVLRSSVTSAVRNPWDFNYPDYDHEVKAVEVLGE